MTIKKLNILELIKIYYFSMRREFPGAELAPLIILVWNLLRDKHPYYGLYEENTLIAYALLFQQENKNGSILLQYFAVWPDKRGKGVGTKMLTFLCERYAGNGILIEVENPKYAPDEQHLAMMQRRIRFYQDNGFSGTDVEVSLFGTEYQIMIYPGKRSDDTVVRREMDAVYTSMFPPKIKEKYAIVR